MLTQQESQIPFDLSTGPLLRIRLLKSDEQIHVLVLTLHHIVFDGWSTNVLLRDLSTLYQAQVQRNQAELPLLSIQYADYAIWQHRVSQDQVLHGHLAYWQAQLTGAPSLTTLPPDHPRPASQTLSGAEQKVFLSTSLHQKLKALSQREGMTLFMLLLSAFQVLVMRTSGQRDIVMGTPIANRVRPEVENLLGLFVNTLALRSDLSGNPSFRDLLLRVREMALQAYAHQDLPFEKVVQSLELERSLSYNALFQIMFTMQEASQRVQHSADLCWSSVALESVLSKFDLTFEVQEREQGLQTRVEYNTDLYDDATITRLLEHWQVLLQAIVEDIEQPIESLPLLTADERAQVLVRWNQTSVAYPEYAALSQLFEEQAARHPDAPAVSGVDGTLSYGELNAQANQLARTLLKQGVQPDTLVGICLDRSTRMLVALFGVLKAGGAYVPIDPAYPADRIAYMLEESQLSCLLTLETILAGLPATSVTAMCLDRDWEQIARETTENVVYPGTSATLAYVIYTSGSTGRPKGVQISQGALINFQLAMRDLFHPGEHDLLLAVTTLSFDIAGLEVYLPLICGAQVALATRETATDGTLLLQQIQALRPTMMQATPATWRLLLEAGFRDSAFLTILCGGEALPADLLEQLLACKPAAFWNLYGPTETTIWSLSSEIVSAQAPITIGRPIANTQVYILDAYQQPVPRGVLGEIYIGGAGLARGYLHQPDLTREKFIPDPFAAQPTARLYRTGDLARYLEDGTLDFRGRIDHQVKIRGFRIELGEIESALEQQPNILQAITVMHTDATGNALLVAYLSVDGLPPKIETLRAALEEQLPAYMLPSAFVFVDSFPLTPSGKIDRSSLPAPDMQSATLSEDRYVEPFEIVHYQLRNIWEELLQARPIGINDNFFHLGGHSLLASRMLARIEQVFGKKISLSLLFARPTIEALTRVLTEQAQGDLQSPLIPIQVAGSKRPFFFFHGDWTGGAYYCFKLAQQAGADQPFYVFEPWVFAENQEIPTIEGQAAMYLKLLRAQQPEGPYYLGGYCNGAIMAYEIAQQLRRQGEQVDFLVLVDPASESLAKNFAQFFGTVLRVKERQHWRLYLSMRHIYTRKVHPWLLRLSGKTDNVLMRSIEVSIEKDPSFARLFPALKTFKQDYEALFAWALPQYVNKPYPGKATFIWAREAFTTEEKDFWIGQVEEAESHIIAGTHYGILTEEIETFATYLGTIIRDAQKD